MTKKPLYTGDPNATMTICYKKMRRHLAIDLQYVVLPTAVVTDIPKTPQDKDAKPPVQIAVICKHCKQNPALPQEPEAVST